MSLSQTIISVLVLDLLLVPPLMIIIISSNFLWIASIASRMGRLGLAFICSSAIFLASSGGYLLIDGDQAYKEHATQDEGDVRNDCERHPGPYGC